MDEWTSPWPASASRESGVPAGGARERIGDSWIIESTTNEFVFPELNARSHSGDRRYSLMSVLEEVALDKHDGI
jgi:hypothetical protein